MIIAKLMGGLGNQMFQYAAARGLALRRKTDVRMDESWFASAVGADTPRHYELDCFALPQKFVSPETFVLVENAPRTLKTTLYDLTKGRSKPRVVHYRESGFSFNKAFPKLPNNTLLEGYWQSERYFVDARSHILKDFSFPAPMSKKNQQTLKQIQATTSVSLHVRRGDYVSSQAANTFHGLTGLDYYKKAVALLAKKVKNPHFFIFSDDPKWCQANLRLDFPTTYVTHNKSGADDMRLMTHCDHHIIANSSFSWWGAWLNPSDKKIVYAPKRWFLDNSVDTSDVIPKDWIKL